MKRKHIFALTLTLLISACTSPFAPEDGTDFFYVKRKNARFPVWVRGQKQSDTFVIIVHGGPGSTGTQYFHYDAYNGLEMNYGVVYWEERASGYSQGNGKEGRKILMPKKHRKTLK